jgi:hypothetical protein
LLGLLVRGGGGWGGAPPPHAAAIELTPNGDYYTTGVIGDLSTGPDTVEVSVRKVPFASGFTVPAAEYRWSHSKEYAGAFAGVPDAMQGGSTLSQYGTVVFWAELQRSDRVTPVSGTPRMFALYQTWDTRNSLGYTSPGFTNYSGTVYAGPCNLGTAPNQTTSSGGSWAQNVGNTWRFARVIRILPVAGGFTIEQRSVAYVLQFGRWSAASSESSEFSATGKSRASGVYPIYGRVIKAANTTDSTTYTQDFQGTLVTGGGYSIDTTTADALWAASSLEALQAWSGGTAEPDISDTLGDLGSVWDLDAVADTFSGLTNGLGWLWPIQQIGGW